MFYIITMHTSPKLQTNYSSKQIHQDIFMICMHSVDIYAYKFLPEMLNLLSSKFSHISTVSNCKSFKGVPEDTAKAFLNDKLIIPSAIPTKINSLHNKAATHINKAGEINLVIKLTAYLSGENAGDLAAGLNKETMRYISTFHAAGGAILDHVVEQSALKKDYKCSPQNSKKKKIY